MNVIGLVPLFNTNLATEREPSKSPVRRTGRTAYLNNGAGEVPEISVTEMWSRMNFGGVVGLVAKVGSA